VTWCLVGDHLENPECQRFGVRPDVTNLAEWAWQPTVEQTIYPDNRLRQDWHLDLAGISLDTELTDAAGYITLGPAASLSPPGFEASRSSPRLATGSGYQFAGGPGGGVVIAECRHAAPRRRDANIIEIRSPTPSRQRCWRRRRCGCPGPPPPPPGSCRRARWRCGTRRGVEASITDTVLSS
jgi:hypothetical protein